MDIREHIDEPLRSDLEIVCSVAKDLDEPIWLVGGPVRDALLRRDVRDLDFLVSSRLEEIVRNVAQRLNGSVQMYPAFRTAVIRSEEGRLIDVTTARTERYDAPGALPVVEPSTVEHDLHRRDFTVNAIAWNCLSGSILDPFQGREDLDARIIRVLHEKSFIDDPTRILRAVRLGERLGFDLEPATERLIRDAVERDAIRTVSSRRIWREILFSFEEQSPEAILRRLNELGVLTRWLQTADDSPSSFEHVERLVKLVSLATKSLDEELLFLGALLHSFEPHPAPPIELSTRRRVLLGRLLAESEGRLERWKRLPDAMSRGRDLLDHSPEEIIFMAMMETDQVAAQQIIQTANAVRSQALPFSGSDLGIEPGSHIGKALRDARVKAWLEDPDAPALLSFAREAALRYLRDRNDSTE